MDDLVANRTSLENIIAAFREAAAYYMMSDDRLAADARSRLVQSTGADPFFATLYQDLNDAYTFVRQSRDFATCVGTQQDLRSVLPWLAVLLEPKTEQQTCCLVGPSSSRSTKALRALHRRTASWDFEQHLERTKIDLLSRVVDLRDPPPQLREGIRRAFGAAVHLRANGFGESHEVEGAEHSWIQKEAIRLCGPLRDVHNAILRDWFCECPTRHIKMLTSFATPCHSQIADVHCVLRFPSGSRFDTVFLDVKEDLPPDAIADTVASSDESHLHDELLRLSAQGGQTARLTFSTSARRWTLVNEAEISAEQHDVIALADLIAANGSQALLKQASYQHRVSLALLIAYAFLELGNSPWMPYTTDHITVWLPCIEGSRPDLLHPFLEVGLDNSDHILDEKSYRFLHLVNRYMPCLPMLGKLIFELISGHAVAGVLDVRKQMQDYDFENPDRAPHVSEAVLSCIEDLDFRADTISGNEKLRTAFLERVISNLHILLQRCPDQDLRTILLRSQPHAFSQRPHATMNDQTDSPEDAQQSSSALIVGREHLEFDYCLHDDGSSVAYDAAKAEKADYFLKKIIDAHDYIESNGSASQNVKVALIDTGVQLHENVRHMYGSKLRECRSWLPSCDDPAGVTKPDGADEDGHGTHCTSALLKCIPEDCEVYVAQVFGGYVDSVPAVSYSNQNATHVAQAIDYAVDTWKVNIISMSFGYETQDDAIEAALARAEGKGVLLIAAASNVGGDTVDARSWPAATRDNVMCIYATEGKGHPYGDNPRWAKDARRLGILGVMVPVWDLMSSSDSITPRVAHRSGTSIASPIAAGVAACVLSFVWRTEGLYLSSCERDPATASARLSAAKKRLLRARGMSEIFWRMTNQDATDHYHFVHPWKLFHEDTTPTTLIENIVKWLK